MGLSSTAIVTVSVGISKALVKLWLNDQKLIATVGQSSLDLLGTRIKDALQRRKIERLFVTIGEEVATSIGQLFEREGVEIDSGAQEAVAREVQAALDDDLLSPRGLAEADLDAEQVGRALVEKNASRCRAFSAAETAMFERMLMEAGVRTLRVVQELPNFLPTTLGRILERQTEIIDSVNSILADLRRMHEAALRSNPEQQVARFEERYRTALERRLNRVELFGVRTGTKKYPLTVAFVTLEAEQASDESGGLIEGTVHEVLGREGHRLWITGLAGAGKTTLLQWLAVQTARAALPNALADWQERVPFFIRLRDFPEEAFPTPPTWVRAAVPPLDGAVPAGWVNEQLDGGRAVVLIDGVDEVPETRRRDFASWAEALMETYPGAIWVFSSRPLLDDGVELKGVREIALRAMGPGQVSQFIEHWHQAVGEEIGTDGDEDLTSLAGDLQTRLRDRPNLRRLITNPLLCAMVCALHRDRRALLPDGRRGLYEACTEMLVDRRDKERRVSAGDSTRLTYEHKKALLTELAYHMLKNRLSQIPIQRMDAQLQRTLPKLNIGTPLSRLELRRYMIERSGLLRMPEPGQVDFVHKSFLEFLAAHAVLDAGDMEFLAEHGTESGWREVALHAASQARGAAEAGALIDALLRRAEAEDATRHSLVLLALAAASEAPQLDPDIRSQIDAAIDALGRPRKVSEAEQWAAAGELVIPLMRGFLSAGVSGPEASAIVRILALVGTPEAIDLLECEFADDDRNPVAEALLFATRHIPSEHREAYARQLLGNRFFRISEVELVVAAGGLPRRIGVSTLQTLAATIARLASPIRRLVIRGFETSGLFTALLVEELSGVEHLTAHISAVPFLADRGSQSHISKTCTLDVLAGLWWSWEKPAVLEQAVETLRTRPDLFGHVDLLLAVPEFDQLAPLVTAWFPDTPWQVGMAQKLVDELAQSLGARLVPSTFTTGHTDAFFDARLDVAEAEPSGS